MEPKSAVPKESKHQDAWNSVYLAALLCFFLSGATGLIYEVLWTRRLTLIFGHSVLAMSTVISAFMGGLALGSVLGGRWIDNVLRRQSGNPSFRLYGFLEIGIGVWAFLTLPLLDLLERAYLWGSQSMGVGLPLQLACFAATAAVLMPATTAMGATVPVLGRLLILNQQSLGSRLSSLYGMNTLGAVLGSGLAGFLLFPWLGLRTSMMLGGCLNVGIGLLAIWVSSRALSSTLPETSDPAEEALPQPQERAQLSLLACFFLAGLASMLYQVGWTRALLITLGSSVYAFSTILLIFLSGLSLGSLAYGRFSRQRVVSNRWLAWCQLWVGCLGVWSIVSLGWLPLVMRQLYPYAGGQFFVFLALGGSATCLVLLPSTFFMGVTFPLVTQLYARHMQRLGSEMGNLYAVNTLGCIVGSFLAGFFLLPAWGAQITLEIAVGISFLACLFSLRAGPLANRGSRAAFAACAMLIPAVGLVPRWDPGLAGSGVGYQPLYQGRSMTELRRTVLRPPAYYRDGLSCTVKLCCDGGDNLGLLVNGKVDATTAQLDLMNMKLTGFVPLLYHPLPKSVALIGLGGGFTLQAVNHDRRVQSIRCAELEKGVVEAAEYFRGFNGDALRDPRVKIEVVDGRNFILSSAERFDVIISQPSNPWIAGIGNLFTVDFYQGCREKLAAQGIFCQWCNLYALSQEDLKMTLRGFFSVFPHGQVWQPSHGDILLIGSATPVKFQRDQLEKMWREQSDFRDDLVGIELWKADHLLGHHLCSRETALVEAGQGSFNTDDKPLLEFSAPRSLYNSHQYEDNYAWLQDVKFRNWSTPETKMMPSEGIVGLVYAWENLGNVQSMQALLPGCPPGPSKAYLLASSQKDSVLRSQAIQTALSSFPENFRIRRLAAQDAAQHRRLEEASSHLSVALRLAEPGWEGPCLEAIANLQLASQKPEEAAETFLRAADYTRVAHPLRQRGAVLLRSGKLEPAREAFLKALERNPYDPVAWQLLGQVYFQLGNYESAQESFQKCLRLVPDDHDALLNSAITYAKKDQNSSARSQLRTLLNYHPEDPPGLKLWQSLESK